MFQNFNLRRVWIVLVVLMSAIPASLVGYRVLPEVLDFVSGLDPFQIIASVLLASVVWSPIFAIGLVVIVAPITLLIGVIWGPKTVEPAYSILILFPLLPLSCSISYWFASEVVQRYLIPAGGIIRVTLLGALLCFALVACGDEIPAPSDDVNIAVEAEDPAPGLVPICDDTTGVDYWLFIYGDGLDTKYAFTYSGVIRMTEAETSKWCNK